ncbi:Rab geranylgeranyltransferase BET4 Ecym_8259 [Eremothecium cymbalariae DBVPG|uniref:Geranylgeranyl transferase type-2 subunit alpha n=1 Tax=Eremothecium cymbalariae (strain CBS 270.75 / DBVPG 7215 / KCTC 17166 / NRRL Y-17582) TaxID=931890 RepID=G8JXG7_ERECY|nr:Hypothetical protein Ecym_8259 [Eremothecium cymbalariae DBVPG\
MHGIKRRNLTQEALVQKRSQAQQQIHRYRSQTAKVLSLKGAKVYSIDALKETTILLDLNPEFNAVWNYRRDIIKGIRDELSEDFWHDELSFTMVQLKSFPKVYWIWNHRVWCLNNCQGNALKLWKYELGIVGKILSMDPRNFHGWHYRRIVVNKLEALSRISMNKDEFNYTTKIINENISNFSAWHQRCQLIPKMLKHGEITNFPEFVQKETDYIINAMFTDADDQSVWTYVHWFIKDECIVNNIPTQEYISMLLKFEENITMINEDEIDFSGKENIWCLKTLVSIESIQIKNLGLPIESHIKDYLNKLMDLDPLRRKKYVHMLNNA